MKKYCLKLFLPLYSIRFFHFGPKYQNLIELILKLFLNLNEKNHYLMRCKNKTIFEYFIPRHFCQILQIF